MENEVIYNWERLPVYAHTNQFARILGSLLVSLPSRLHIHVHNLIGQTMAMSNAIPGAYRDVAPGEDPPTIEERRAWLSIGCCACRLARDLLTELGRVAKGSQKNVTAGLTLLSQIESSFEQSLESLEDAPPAISVQC